MKEELINKQKKNLDKTGLNKIKGETPFSCHFHITNKAITRE
ncbi:MAG: hypothetical protein UR14_C0006G0079 [candidate division TM6 bacterium GW2011_GWE2_31_21]|nr:MAG: hypothetical protein UR14_C0006G0079 [candidate division TM6 bacterium GW2011_GWE2_31_21]KKP53498.1 MAG: hypothetical protein UR43_C0004G0039 [candidate division TM6 bacterium GW2011_GWF2_33_332]